ncbi:MAG: amino acid permease [Holosporaceae bacterium]|jgi:APA family basic amino acid/polyamine antiporter|nr:amino acid permease [Holosporaceae bacterium]
MSKKMGFYAVLAIVFGSQIGSGIFVLPASLAPFGMFGIFGWIFAGIGAMLLAFVFADLCAKFPQTGGPHAYVQHVFGRTTAFFVGWTYWLVSWTSTSVVVVSAIACLNPFLGKYQSPYAYLFLETCLLCVVTWINCKSVKFSGEIEFILTLLKFIPFVVVPAVIFQKFDISNIRLSPQYADYSAADLATIVASMSFWGFIGVECATAPAEAVENPSKTIPRAIIIGTLGVALVYLINNLAIMGAIPGNLLETSKSPYVDAINLVFGRNLSMVIAVITSLVLIGTFNAWVLTSAQISLGLAQDGLLPPFFAKKNSNGAPYVSVVISCFGMIPILILTKNENLSEQLNYIIDFSVKSFLMIYGMCCLAFIKINLDSQKILKTIGGIAAFSFCLLIIATSSLQSITVSLMFMLSGIFMLPFAKIKEIKKIR